MKRDELIKLVQEARKGSFNSSRLTGASYWKFDVDSESKVVDDFLAPQEQESKEEDIKYIFECFIRSQHLRREWDIFYEEWKTEEPFESKEPQGAEKALRYLLDKLNCSEYIDARDEFSDNYLHIAYIMEQYHKERLPGELEKAYNKGYKDGLSVDKSEL